MGECPFCGGEVEEDLICFGGPCPKCFAEIPGEEAATDPGEEVKQALERRDTRRSTMRAVVPIVMALPVVACLGIAALWFGVFKPVPEVALLDFDSFEDYPMPDIVAVSPEEAAELERAEAAGSTGPARPRTGAEAAERYAGGGTEFSSGGVDLGGDGVAAVDRGTRGTRQGDGAASGGVDLGAGEVGRVNAVSAGTDINLDVGASRRGGVIEDPEAIRKMIFTRMSAQMARLNTCYEMELKRDDSIEGRWRIRYTVQADGKVKDAQAVAVNRSVPSFEECMSREVAKWSFQRIKDDQPVQKTINFRPAG